MAFTRFSSPIGEILLCGGAAGLQRVVLAADGLGSYSGGPDLKRRLLVLEGSSGSHM